MAVWALSRLLDADRFAAARARCLPNETDAAVAEEWTRNAPPARRLAG
jgi:epoxyqueuosine reductase